jgi:hypothetical protein
MYGYGMRGVNPAPSNKGLANSAAHAWFWSPVFWQTFTCDPNREDLPTMTEQANSATDPLTADAADPQTKRMNPGDQPVDPGSGRPREIGGRQGPEPTRYGDWEMRGRCIDF